MPTDQDLFNAITDGLAATAMEGWNVLSGEQRWQLVRYLKTFSQRFRVEDPQPIDLRKNVSLGTEAVGRGKELYRQMKCFLCHGEDGRGDGPITVTMRSVWEMPFDARNLTRADRYKGGSSTEDIYRTISTGLAGTPMDSYTDYMDSEERWYLAAYVKTLQLEPDQMGRVVFRSRHVSGELPLDPDDDTWEKVDALEIPLSGQVIVQPRLRKHSIDLIKVKSLYNDSDIAFLLQWDDRTMTAEPVFQDAVALQFPIEISEGPVKPYFFMGQPGKSVNIWQWEAGSDSVVTELVSGGFEAVKVQPDTSQQVKAKATWKEGKWRVVLTRPLQTGDLSMDTKFEKGKLIPVAFSAWDGSNGEIGLRKSLSSWYYLVLETSRSPIVYLYTLIGILGAVNVQFWLIRRARQSPPDDQNAKPLSKTGRVLLVSIVLIIPLSLKTAGGPGNILGLIRDPYLRAKNGPPLTNVVHKVNVQWLTKWLREPRSHDPTAQMPNLQLEDAEIRAIISYLNSVADPVPPKVGWDPYLMKDEQEWTDEDWVQLDMAIPRGEKVWRQSRCTICHIVEGRGGFVNLKVGKSLGGIGSKVNRDWLYQWIRNPQSYFAHTLMPRFRLSDREIKDLVVYMAYGDPFLLYDEDEEIVEEILPSEDTAQIASGKRIIELSRCILCHDIKGIGEIMPVAEEETGSPGGFIDLLNDVMCLTCHTVAGKGGDYAPELTYEGSKMRVEWITDFLITPDIIRPLSQQMPRFNLTKSEAETAARFVKENLLRPGMNVRQVIVTNPTPSEIEAGENIYRKRGCQGCHAINGQGGSVGPDLTYVGDRLEAEYIFFHLKDPNLAVPFSPEPNYGLSDEEALALTHFLIARRQ